LTLDGHKPTSLDALALKTHEQNKRLHCWSYQGRLRNWLEDCRKNCEAQTIKNFLADFLAYIELELKRESENQ